MPKKLTAEEYAESARILGTIIDAAVVRHKDEGRRELATEAAMRVLAECCSQLLVQQPADGADLGAILIGHQFRKVLSEYGLVLMPLAPSATVRAAFAKGWLRGFQRRYEDAIQSAWGEDRHRPRSGIAACGAIK